MRDRLRAQRARFEQEAATEEVTFTLSGDERLSVSLALDQARRHVGTPLDGRALAHVCRDYLARGVPAEAARRAGARHEILAARAEDLLAEMTPEEALDALRRAHPKHEW